MKSFSIKIRLVWKQFFDVEAFFESLLKRNIILRTIKALILNRLKMLDPIQLSFICWILK